MKKVMHGKTDNITILKNSNIIKNIPNFNNLIEESNEMAFTYFGLNLEDIYNCLVNDYYLSTKRIKWLIFNNPVGSKIYLNIKSNYKNSGMMGLEPTTLSVTSLHSNQLSYIP